MGARSPKALGRTSLRGLAGERWRDCSSLRNTRKLPAPRVRGAADSPALRETAAPAPGAGHCTPVCRCGAEGGLSRPPNPRCLLPSARQPEGTGTPLPPGPPARGGPRPPRSARPEPAWPELEPRPRTGAALGGTGEREMGRRKGLRTTGGQSRGAALQLTLSCQTSGADHTCYQSGHIPNHSTIARQPGASSYRKVLLRRSLLARAPAPAGSTRLRPAPVQLQPGRPAPHPSLRGSARLGAQAPQAPRSGTCTTSPGGALPAPR